jgi:hypothetical protein
VIIRGVQTPPQFFRGESLRYSSGQERKFLRFQGEGFARIPVSTAYSSEFPPLGESQFPLQVTVSDFWGAITVGFVGNFVGLYLIQKLVDMVPEPRSAGTTGGSGTGT